MPEQLKIIIDADVNKAITGVQNLSKVITSDFVKATNSASIAASNLSKDVANSVQKINASLSGLKVTSLDVSVNLSSVDASIKSIQSKFAQLVDPELNVLANTVQAEAKIKDLLSELSSLKGSEIFIRANDVQALKVINEVESELKSLVGKQIDLSIRADLGKLEELRAKLSSLKVTPIDVGVNTSLIDASIKNIQSKFAALLDPKINVLADTAQAEIKIKELISDLSALKGSEIFIRANDTQALQKINEIEKELNTLVGKQINLSVTTDLSKLNELQVKIDSLKVTPISVSVNTSSIDASIKSIQSKFAAIVDPQINVLANTQVAEIKIKELMADLSALKGSEVFIRANDTQALRVINEVETELNSLLDKQIRLNVITTDATQKINLLEKELLDLQSLTISPNISTSQLALFEKNIIRIKSEIASLKGQGVDLGAISLNSSQITAAIEQLKNRLSALQAQIPITVTVQGLEKLNADIAKTKADLNSLIGKNIKVDVDATAALQKVGTLKAQLATISNVPFKVNTQAAVQTISGLQNQVHRLDQSLKTVGGLNSFQSALGKSTQAIKNLQATGSGLNNFYANLVTQNNRAAASLSRLPISSNQASQALINLGRVAQDAPFGFLGIANNLNPLLESFQRLKATAGTTGGALKAMASSLMGPAGIGIAVSVVSSLLIVFGDRLFGAGKKAEEAEDKIKTLNDSLKDIQGQAAKEAAGAAGLIAVLKSETETRERKIAALKELKSIQPEIFGQLKLEGEAVSGLDAAYKKYIDNLRLVITAKLKQAQLEGITQKILEKEGLVLTQSQKEGLDFIKKTIAGLNEQGARAIKTGNATAGQLIIQKRQTEKQQEGVVELNNLYKDQAQLIKDITELSKGIKIDIDTTGGKADFDKFINDVISRAKQFAKEFGNAFVVPELEESFFVGKEEIFKRATKLLDDLSKDKLQIKIPVEADFELLPVTEGASQSTIDGFFKGLKAQANIPVEVIPDLTLAKGSLDKIDQKLNLRQQFSILGDFGLKEFNKIDFSNINAGIAEATKRLQGMMDIANTLNQAIGQGLSNAFNSVFDAVLEGKSVFKALGQAIKELVVSTIKAIAQMLILRLVTNAIFGGAGGAIPLPRLGGGIGGQANLGFGGIGSSAFNNVLQVQGTSTINGNDIVISFNRASNSSGRFG